MKQIAKDLEKVIEEYYAKLEDVPEQDWSLKPSPEKWSKKEVIGHLIDSAQNNMRRFIVPQYEENPIIKYNQDKWVNINNYQQTDLPSLLSLWYLFNKQIVTVIKNTPNETAHATCHTDQLHSIGWLATDYIKHLKHHLHQVLDLEPVDYP